MISEISLPDVFMAVLLLVTSVIGYMADESQNAVSQHLLNEHKKLEARVAELEYRVIVSQP